MEKREQFRGVESFLAQQGFRDLARIKQRGEGGVFSAEDAGKRVVVKIGRRVDQGIDLIENQHTVSDFLARSVQNERVFVPESKLVIRDGWTASVSTAIDGEVFSSSEPEGMHHEMTSAEVVDTVSFLADIRSLPEIDIPASLQEIARTGWNKQFYATRLRANAENPIRNGFLTEQERDRLQEIWERHYDVSHVQHHDIVPFNLMRTKDQKIALLDGEFGRIGMTGYDPAYFVLQTAGLLHRPEAARHFLQQTLDTWEQRFPQDALPERILSPFAYRVIASFNDPAPANDIGVRERTVALKEAILTDDISQIIATLDAMKEKTG